MNVINTVAYIHIENKKLLLVRARNKKAFYMPGGKPDKDENSLLALIREIKEEIDLEILPHFLKYYGLFEAQAYGKDQGTMVRIECYTGKHKNKPKALAEIEELKFFSSQQYLSLPDTAAAVELIINDLKEKGFID